MIGRRTVLTFVVVAAAVLTAASGALDPTPLTSRRHEDPLRALTEEFAGHKAFTRPNQDADMGFNLPTRVMEILAKAGQRVKAGQMLIRGDDAEDVIAMRLQRVRAANESSVHKAQNAVELATLEYERILDADRRGSASPQEVDRGRLSLEAARNDLATAQMDQEQQVISVDRFQARVDRLRLVAPFEGHIDIIRVDVGQSVTENDKIIRVVDVDPLLIDVPTPTDESMRLAVKPGDDAWVLMDMAGRPVVLRAKVSEVAPTADASSRTRRIRVELPNPDRADGSPGELVAGEPAWVRFTPPDEAWMRRAESFGLRADGSKAGEAK